MLRIALRAIGLPRALDPGDLCGPWTGEARAAQETATESVRRSKLPNPKSLRLQGIVEYSIAPFE
jgi:hypothetical protein